MIFKVENLGAIQHAEIDLSKDLILFCGHNNTGKTYLAYAIYLLLKANINSMITTPHEIPNKYRGKVKSIDLVDIFDLFDNLEVRYQEQINNYMSELYLFLSTENYGMKFNIDIPKKELNEKLIKMDFVLESSGSGGWRQKYEKNSNYREMFLSLETAVDSALFDFHIFPMIFRSRCVFFPVERSAINIFSKELSLCKAKLFEKLWTDRNQPDLLDLASRRINRYPRSIRDHLEIAEDLANLAKNTSEFNKLAEELETEILGGKIHISQYGDLSYQPSSAQNIALGMELSSSTVGSLSSLVFYLRHLAKKGDTLIIDEPELSLHPDNQRLIARFFGRLINAGFKLIISTHSDYIVREINNLIMLSKKSRKTAGLRKKYGYTQAQVLQPQQVGAYLFKRGEPSPISIEVSETGLEISTIDEVVADLNQSSQDIYFSLFD